LLGILADEAGMPDTAAPAPKFVKGTKSTEGIVMNRVHRSVLAGMATALLSTVGAFAADLNNGSIKDNGYQPAMSSRPALFYVRGDFTASANDFGSMTEPPAYTYSSASLANNRAWGAGLGMYFTPSVRGDLTLDWSGSGAARGTILDGVATVQGERQFGVKHVVGLANLYYDFDTRSRFTPYLGVGLGFARNTTIAGQVVIQGCDASSGGAAANCAANMDGATKTNAAGALMAGFSAKLGDRWNVDAGYRFLYLGDARTSDIQITRIVNNPAWPQSAPAATVHDMYAHQFRVGLRMDVR